MNPMKGHARAHTVRRGQDAKPHADIGKRLAACRSALGYDSAKRFAETLEIPANTYRNQEVGRNFPSRYVLNVLADYGIDMHYLIAGEGPMFRTRTTEKRAVPD